VQAISKLYTKLLSIDHTIDPNKEVLVTDGAYEALFTGDLFLKLFLFIGVFRIRCGSEHGASFFVNADPDLDSDPGKQTNAGPKGSGSGSWSGLPSQKIGF
jgi:hypothetical protein